jgi:hypothetical protein
VAATTAAPSTMMETRARWCGQKQRQREKKESALHGVKYAIEAPVPSVEAGVSVHVG